MTNRRFKTLFLTLVVGVGLTALTGFSSHHSSELYNPDICFGPTVIGYTCQANAQIQRKGLPLSYMKTTELPDSSSTGNATEYSIQAAIADVMLWTAFALLVLLTLKVAKLVH